MTQENIQTMDSANAQVKDLVRKHLVTNTLTIEQYNKNLKETTKVAQDLRTDLMERTPSPQEHIGKLTALINALEEKQDLRLGIIRTKKEDEIAFVGADKELKSSVIIRDARLQKTLREEGIMIADRPNNVAESWMINIAATTRGIIKLLTLPPTSHNSEIQINATLGLFEECMKKLEDTNNSPEKLTQITEHFNYKIKNQLNLNTIAVAGQRIKDLTDKEFNKLLGNTRDFTNFETDHHTTISITDNLSKKENLNHIESFIPVVPLSQKLKDRYSNTSQTWRDKDLSPINRALVNAYSDKITDGKHIIPTQLQFLPGIRNYGVTSTLFARENVIIDDHQYIGTRSAAPAYNTATKSKTDKNLMQQITNENVDHINHMAKASGRTLHINTITNEIGNEKSIGDAVRNSAKNFQINTTKTPLSVTLSNKDKNLSTIWNSFEKGKLKDCVHFCCKSGKDRTGLADKHNQLSAIQGVLGKNIDKKEKVEAFSTYNSSFHNENLAGSNGGSLGSYGLKAKTSYLFLSTKNLMHSIKEFTLGNKVSDLNTPKAKLSKGNKAVEGYDQNDFSNSDTTSLLGNGQEHKKSAFSAITTFFKRGSANRDF